MLDFICNEFKKQSFYLVLVTRGGHYVTVYQSLLLVPGTCLPLHNVSQQTAFPAAQLLVFSPLRW